MNHDLLWSLLCAGLLVQAGTNTIRRAANQIFLWQFSKHWTKYIKLKFCLLTFQQWCIVTREDLKCCVVISHMSLKEKVSNYKSNSSYETFVFLQSVVGMLYAENRLSTNISPFNKEYGCLVWRRWGSERYWATIPSLKLEMAWPRYTKVDLSKINKATERVTAFLWLSQHNSWVGLYY